MFYNVVMCEQLHSWPCNASLTTCWQRQKSEWFEWQTSVTYWSCKSFLSAKQLENSLYWRLSLYSINIDNIASWRNVAKIHQPLEPNVGLLIIKHQDILSQISRTPTSTHFDDLADSKRASYAKNLRGYCYSIKRFFKLNFQVLSI